MDKIACHQPHHSIKRCGQTCFVHVHQQDDEQETGSHQEF